MTADLQSRRRLGLTATLVREDGREGDVFSLIGPKRYDAPWRDIEAQGWIAPADCVEVRVTLTDAERMATRSPRPRSATGWPPPRARSCRRARRSWTGTRASQCWSSAPTSTSSTSSARPSTRRSSRAPRRTRSASGSSTQFRQRRDAGAGGLQGRQLLDRPARGGVAIQVSGTFGSRQEEAQRLGRVLRPKGDGRQAHFYTVVSRDTIDTEYAAHRQRFLAEQGYAYTIVDADDLLGPARARRRLSRRPRRGVPLGYHPLRRSGCLLR